MVTEREGLGQRGAETRVTQPKRER
jgi:hypothetical protein